MLRNLFVSSAILVLAVSTSPLAQAAGKIGKVVAVSGQPSANGPGGNRKLSKNSDVFEDDTIVVASGNAQITLDDGTRLVVGPSSTLLLDQFVMSGKSKADKVAIKALRGTYRFITGRSPKSAYKITTAHATIGIRGTGFDFWVRNKTGAVVLTGAVNLGGRNGGNVVVNSGCQMGEATTGAANLLRGQAKTEAIKKNLPFLIDQSNLNRRFRLNVTTCRLVAPEENGSGGISAPPSPPQRGNND
jgi:hypothetical protein